jgi:hypothetical protein
MTGLVVITARRLCCKNLLLSSMSTWGDMILFLFLLVHCEQQQCRPVCLEWLTSIFVNLEASNVPPNKTTLLAR